MAYNVFVSRYSNNSDIIKNAFSKSTSNAMSAYISNKTRIDHNLNSVLEPKVGRDDGEVDFSALILPSDIPLDVLEKLGVYDSSTLSRVIDRFERGENVKGSEHYILQNSNVISVLWSLNDKNIHNIQESSDVYKNRQQSLRLYDLYLFTSPVAHKHFPPEMNITADDLRAIDEKAIYEICDEFFLSKGLAVELGRHKNKENIVHYHLQTTNRVFKYKYENEDYSFDHSAFVRWLSKAKLEPLRNSVITNRNKKNSWQQKYDVDPSDYNLIRLNNWSQKLIKLEEELTDVTDIIAGLKKSGLTYSTYQEIYLKNMQKKINKTMISDSVFASHKGEAETYLDTYQALDLIKEKYAQVLNRLLIEEGIIKPDSELYKFSKSLRDFITVKEARIFNISDEKRVEINKTLNQVFKMDEDFFYYESDKNFLKRKRINRKTKTRKRLIIHGLKTIIKEHLASHKPIIAQSEQALNKWVKLWKHQLDEIRGKYSKLIDTLLQHHIYNFNWRKPLMSNLLSINKEFVDEKEFEIPFVTSEQSYEKVEVVDIDIPYDYEDENEINFESFPYSSEDESGAVELEMNVRQNAEDEMEYTWDEFDRMCTSYSSELSMYNYQLEIEDQIVRMLINKTELEVHVVDLYDWLHYAKTYGISLFESIYSLNPELIRDDDNQYQQTEIVDYFERELER